MDTALFGLITVVLVVTLVIKAVLDFFKEHEPAPTTTPNTVVHRSENSANKPQRANSPTKTQTSTSRQSDTRRKEYDDDSDDIVFNVPTQHTPTHSNHSHHSGHHHSSHDHNSHDHGGHDSDDGGDDGGDD